MGKVKQTKTRAELETMISDGLRDYAAPKGLSFSIACDGKTWRPIMDAAPGEIANHVDWLAKAVQISDKLKAQFDLAD